MDRIILTAAFLLAGCGHAMPDYDKARGVLATAAKDCYSTVQTFDLRTQKQIQADFKAHKISGDKATEKLDDWLATNEQASTVCRAADELNEAAQNARAVVAAAVDRDKQVAAWIARLAAFGLTIPASLARLGITGGP